MPLQLHPASYSDMDELIKVMYAANSDPHDPFIDLCCPGLNPDSGVRRVRGERETAENYLADWENSETEFWMKVVDSDTGRIVSASNWDIIEQDREHDVVREQDADWLPHGSRLREYANFLLYERAEQGARYNRQAHVSLDICFTLPRYRRRGAASMMLQWGVEKAEELGLKMLVEATVTGRALYERFGFVTREVVDVRREGMEGDAEWEMLERRYPLICCWMERPVKR